VSGTDPLRDSLATATPGFVSSDWVAAGEQWLEVAQFQTEERAQQFREDFMSVAGMEEMSHLSGPGFAEAVAGDLGMSGGWQTMDQEALEKLKAGEWALEHPAEVWQPRLNEASNPALDAAYLDLDL
jgi:hypothetical protein